jgi:hypothetical protein
VSALVAVCFVDFTDKMSNVSTGYSSRFRRIHARITTVDAKQKTANLDLAGTTFAFPTFRLK